MLYLWCFGQLYEVIAVHLQQSCIRSRQLDATQGHFSLQAHAGQNLRNMGTLPGRESLYRVTVTFKWPYSHSLMLQRSTSACKLMLPKTCMTCMPLNAQKLSRRQLCRLQDVHALTKCSSKHQQLPAEPMMSRPNPRA